MGGAIISIKKVGNSWSFRIEAGTDPKTGRRKQVYRGGFKTKRETQEEMIKIQNEIDEGNFFEPSKEQFKDFITKWLNSTYKSEVQITSFEKAQTIIRVHLVPYFQLVPIAKITTYDIDQFYASKLNEGLSNAYVKIMHNILSKAFQKALQWELIKTNPVKESTPPRISKTRKQTWTVDEAKIFLEFCKRENYLIPFQLAIFTGMRRGEILALRWRNVDLVKGVIYVEENLVRSKNKGLLLKELKTDYSLREIFISESVITSLQKHKTSQDQMKSIVKNFKDLD
ncbi:Arm DNA-binding domain-containing protein [Bacillus sp. JJ664]